ncbi:MAG TPA: DUF1223 domain-containing protein, partial [Vicinamibacterales bacterium]|nr:DUF1223 domain-containing protein [Vicinamibacterales bacterium]
WKDPFSSPQFTGRQNAYARAFGSDRIYTPQLVIDGRYEVVGSDWPAVRRALSESARTPRAMVRVSGTRSADSDHASVRVVVRDLPKEMARNGGQTVIAVVEDGLVTDVARGENARRRLRHSAVVRMLETIGSLEPGATAGEFVREVVLDRTWRRDRIRIVGFVQDVRTLSVSGVGAAALPN